MGLSIRHLGKRISKEGVDESVKAYNNVKIVVGWHSKPNERLRYSRLESGV